MELKKRNWIDQSWEKKFDTLDNAFFGTPQIDLTILQMTVGIGDFCQSTPKQSI